MSCKEQNYELIGNIAAYPENAISFVRPFLEERKYLTSSDYTASSSDKVVIPLKPETGNMKESVTRDAAGEHYEVTVTCDVEDVTPALCDALDALKDAPNHLILRTFPNNEMLVRAADYSYEFTYHENAGVLSLEWVIQNKTGAQRIL